MSTIRFPITAANPETEFKIPRVIAEIDDISPVQCGWSAISSSNSKYLAILNYIKLVGVQASYDKSNMSKSVSQMGPKLYCSFECFLLYLNTRN